MRKGQKKTNSFTVDGDIVTVEIVKRDGTITHTLCDKDLWFGFLDQYTWFEHEGYAKTTYKGTDGKKRTIGMHAFVLNRQDKRETEDGIEVDHILREQKLNNTKSNLREVTCRQQSQNRRTYKDGVYENRGYFKTQIRMPKSTDRVSLGGFVTREEAEQQYQRALAIVDTCTRQELEALRPAPRKRGQKKKAGDRPASS